MQKGQDRTNGCWAYMRPRRQGFGARKTHLVDLGGSRLPRIQIEMGPVKWRKVGIFEFNGLC